MGELVLERGGLGFPRELRLIDGESRYSVLSDRAVLPPFGVGGAGPAASARVSVRRGGVEIEFATPGKITGHPIAAGDVVVMESAGGGGFGDPLARDPARVRADVRAGYVSPERAHAGYGVVLTTAGEVDAAATGSERARLASARRRWPVVADERNPYEGGRGRHRVLRLAPTLARALGVDADNLVEMLGRHPAPLRAWVRVDRAAPAEAVGLDAFGRRVLGVSAGDEVLVRRLAMPPIPGGLVGAAGRRDTYTER